MVDPDRGRVAARIRVGKRPRGIRLSPDGRTLLVALSGSPIAGPGVDESTLPPADRAADGIGIVDLAAARLVRVLPSGQDPEAFDIAADGRTVYVSNEETGEMSVVDVATGTIRRVPVGGEPEGVTLRPDGRVVYVTAEAEHDVVAVDTATLKVVARIPGPPIGRAPWPSPPMAEPASSPPRTAARSPCSTSARTARRPPSWCRRFRPRRWRRGRWARSWSPDGQRMYVCSARAAAVGVIDVASNRVLHSIRDVGRARGGSA